MLVRNVGNSLLIKAALPTSRAKISFMPRWKPEISYDTKVAQYSLN